ncbi:MAG: hypothetical protein ACQEST_00460 [Bacteroidota bacterium]
MIRPALRAFIILFLFNACTESISVPEPEEPAGVAEYYVNNKSSVDLTVVFTKSSRLDSETDTTYVKDQNVEIIFDDAIIESNPKPSDSFSSMEFYKTSDPDEPVMTIDPVSDQDWVVADEQLDENGYGLTQYEFEILEEDLE